MDNDLLERARAAIDGAHALVLAAGAGMGVDSGLPDFRGTEGFWRAYPPFAKLGLSFSDLASPRWFRDDPELAWGFYGHRLHLYRDTKPHAGFQVLLRWARAKPGGGFVFTSNVDGAFSRAGFDDERIVECHGAIDFVQCTAHCGLGIVPADDVTVDVDPETFRARAPLPSCPRCGSILRPNMLLFGDGDWDGSRADAQEERMSQWLAERRAAKEKIVVVECGAGTAIPSVRMTSERLASRADATLVRINVREPEVPAGHIGIAGPARATLEAIDERA